MKIAYEKIPYTYEHFFQGFRYLTKDESYYCLLESGRGGKFSIAGIKPYATAKAIENGIEIHTEDHKEKIMGVPLRAFEQWMKQFQISTDLSLPDFQGGAIGFISYDYARHIEKLPNKAIDDLGLPELYFFIFKEWFIFDHDLKQLWIVQLLENEEEDCLEYWKRHWTEAMDQDVKEDPLVKKKTDENLEVSLSEEQFKDAVEKVREYIAAGDVFQVNLSVRQSKPLDIPAIEVYAALRKLNPSPYMSYIHTPEFQVVSGSPELLVKKSGQDVFTRPIAGTRSRGKTEEEDLKLASELIENEKERAEHVMLVDLERNDFGRVCAYGTVEVNEFMVIEKYSHVMHIVSNVRGKLAEGKTGYDAIEAVFPGGTITGAPKVRTMEIIEELEPVRRGLYTGSIGWIGFNGDLELNIVIRTMLVKDNKSYVQAGAGVVIDSNPKHEYKESLKKAFALWKAKEEAEEGVRI
ncbi:para-aminobenzoate synthetase component 1 [Oikeobacillus pervagus]|uniref:Para-aminobenzoate synthetase component 1 n=1 Tax=Oikeobacillus pervagus TaxID=1325931 RepID=A0AAJ1WJU8_9BACI|nr:anthranilate synthase component I family protein [Oikeobacillus pervagus]MDQ0215893.1 para-aminobenzoate synthetase component 1 [Oikeobacillus pervagus]